MQPVFVTGGAGYIGSHICKALRRQSYLPVTLDNLSQGHAALVRWGPLEQGDVRDTAWLRDMLRRYAPGAVIHCAGLISVSESTSNPALYYSHNVGGTLSLLDAMVAEGTKPLIFSSSCAVHGQPETVPVREDAPCRPLSPYGRSKWIAEQAIADYAAAYGISYANLRYFNAAGGDPDGETGEMHQPETHAVPLAVEAAIRNTPFMLFGTDYPTPDGTAMRDYVHVSDLATAHVMTVQYLQSGGASCTLNIGSGQGTSVRQLIDAVAGIAGRKLTVQEKARRPGDPAMLVADPALARATLGFSPAISDIRSIAKTAWQWYAALDGHALPEGARAHEMQRSHYTAT